MEPVTHFLTGAVLARTGFNRRTALATFTMMLAAEAPDVDVVAYLGGSATGFIQHRGITHTFLGLPFIAGLTVAVVWLLDALWQRWRRRRDKPAPPVRRWGLLYFYACIAVLTHLLLDFTNNYGLRPFYPFSPRWYAWDIVFIIEPVMLAALALALILPPLFALVGQEIGERRRTQPRGRGLAIAALLFIVALWGFRDYQHRRALAVLDSFQYQGESARRIAASPYMINPFRWAGVAETSKAYVSLPLDSLHGVADPERTGQSYYKPEETAATAAARRSRLGAAYIEWARFPLMEAEQQSTPEHNTVVHLEDVRYLYPDFTGERRHVLEAYVLLSSSMRVLSEGFGQPPVD
jgi:inner membrane protein